MTRPSASPILAACAESGHLDTRTAATELADKLADALPRGCDLAVVFASYHHRAALPDAVEAITRTIRPGTILAVTAEAVVGPEEEFENTSGMTAVAMKLPGTTVTPWWATPEFPLPIAHEAALRQRLHLSPDFRGALMMGDPFTTPITRILPAVSRCGGPKRRVPVAGALLSGASQPGYNVLVMDELVMRAGVIGAALAGHVQMDIVVSQGCRPIGRPFVVTKVRDNVVLELAGRRALDAMQEVLDTLPEPDQPLIGKGLLLGHVIDEHKRPIGRGDFLVRSLLGIDAQRGGIVVGDIPRAGQTVQFHVRDAATAADDLDMLLDAHVLGPPPIAGLLFTCNGRGRRLFGEPNHDVRLIRRRLGPIPLAGMFAAGEIGPIGDTNFLHGHTACLVLFRKRTQT